MFFVEAIKQRDFELKRTRKSNNPEDWAKFKRTKCYVISFFQESIESNKGNPSKIWKALKSLTKSKKQSDGPGRITELSMEDGSTVTDMTEMANIFNEFFFNIASNLRVATDKLQMDTSKLENFISSTFDNYITQFNIPAMTEEETLKMIEILLHGKATGSGDISVKVLKLVAPAFCHPLTKFFNLSLQNGYFPRKWKIARVTPLYKNGTRDNKDNYRIQTNICAVYIIEIVGKTCCTGLCEVSVAKRTFAPSTVRFSRRSFYRNDTD